MILSSFCFLHFFGPPLCWVSLPSRRGCCSVGVAARRSQSPAPLCVDGSQKSKSSSSPSRRLRLSPPRALSGKRSVRDPRRPLARGAFFVSLFVSFILCGLVGCAVSLRLGAPTRGRERWLFWPLPCVGRPQLKKMVEDVSIRTPAARGELRC